MTLLGYSDEAFLQIYHDISERALDKISNEPYKYDTYNLTPHHFQVFEQINRDYPDAYKILTKKKLHIGVTMETGFRWFKRFRSNNDLFNCLLCSFHVPFLCSYNAMIDGVRCIDGGFGCDIDKHLPPKTLIICPRHLESNRFDVLNGEMTVKACATPSSLEERLECYKQGYDDMSLYMKTGKCATTTTGKIDEAIVPNYVWWALRTLQPDDSANVLSNIIRNQTF
jgi:nitrite reductase/ring-hydroxylating ferredoxin subunit